MDQERTLLIVAVGVAVAVGCFVLWGPSSFRPKRKKGHVIGLANLGHTCFLNTLLQALASCPSVIDWLLQQKNGSGDSLIAALRTVLLVLNGDIDCNISDPYAPTEVIAALIQHNWVISPGEQDAHELFHVLLETLEEEMTNLSTKNGSLSDILLPERSGQGDVGLSHKIRRIIPSYEIKFLGDRNNVSFGAKSQHIRRINGSENDSALPITSSVDDLYTNSQIIPPPFRGMLTSQLKCTSCGFKSALRYDKFDTLSLPLPTSTRRCQLTLQMLLDNFVGSEIVNDVTCTNCSKGHERPVQTTAMKTLNFGKLPKCLCLHIVRTTWNKEGLPWKREDFVDFPEFLIMDNYTHSQRQLNAKKLNKIFKNSEDTREENETTDVSNGIAGGIQSMSNATQESLKKNDVTSSSAKHMYRLKGVIVHTGNIHSGHFITYRKGPVKSLIRHRLFSEESKMDYPESRESTRWFYTSDTVVKRATLCDALLSNAYMLFYEKCVPPNHGLKE